MNSVYLEDTTPNEFERKSDKWSFQPWIPTNMGGWVMMILAGFMTIQLIVRGAELVSTAEAQPSYKFEQVSYSAELTRDYTCPAH